MNYEYKLPSGKASITFYSDNIYFCETEMKIPQKKSDIIKALKEAMTEIVSRDIRISKLLSGGVNECTVAWDTYDTDGDCLMTK